MTGMPVRTVATMVLPFERASNHYRPTTNDIGRGRMLARTTQSAIPSWRLRLRELVARWRAYRGSQVRYTTVMLPDGSYEHLRLRRWPSGRVDATVRKITYNGKRRPITDAHRLNAHLAAHAMWSDFYGDEVWGGSED